MQTCAYQSELICFLEANFNAIVGWLANILFYQIPVPFVEGATFPFVVLWLVIGGVFFTLRLGFVNIRMFSHAIKVVAGKYSNPNDKGQISHFQALSAAVSATVGLGNIAGVAVAVSIGGPGAVIWMVIAALFGMSTKFAEVTMGQKYRQISADGRVSGGAFYYLRDGIKQVIPNKFGKILGLVLAAIFAVSCLFGAIGAGGMFQSNQTVKIIGNTFAEAKQFDIMISTTIALAVGIVLIGGIKRIASVAERIVPLMAVIYLSAGLVVLVANANAVPAAISTMFELAFDTNSNSIYGGIIGAIIVGFKRASFSNEAGIGSAPIAHSAAKTNEPVREGCVALLEPFIDTVIICFMTGIIITVTGVYEDKTIEGGVLMTSAAFSTVIDWFPVILSICIAMFAYSTMITWSYYGEKAWGYLFGQGSAKIFHVIFCTACFFGGIINFKPVLDFADLMILGMAIPNLIGLYILSNSISRDVKSYKDKLKAGEFG